MQEKRNSNMLAKELHLSYIYPSNYNINDFVQDCGNCNVLVMELP